MKFFGNLVIFLSMLSACSTADKSLPPENPQFTFNVLIRKGVSKDISLHPQGDRFLFVSSQRFEHTHPQVYEYIFSSSGERRVTFQDGQTARPHYVAHREIVYQSTTDQIKESLLRKPASLEEISLSDAFEVYRSDLFGNSIERLTYNKGFDGNLRVFSRGESRGISYLSQIGTERKLVLYRDNNTWSPNLKAEVLEAQVFGAKNKLLTSEKSDGKEVLRLRDLKSLKILNEWPLAPQATFSTSQNEQWVWILESQADHKTRIQALDWQENCLNTWLEVPFEVLQIEEIPGQMNQFLLVLKNKTETLIVQKELSQPSCQKIVSQ